MAMKKTKELSIFIDESGDFGDYNPKSPYYIIGMVAHDQSENISQAVTGLDARLSETELKRNFVHIGPLIRKEAGYKHMLPAERAKVLWKMMTFVKQVPFACKAFVVEKKHIKDDTELIGKLARQLSDYVREHYPYFLGFDKIKIYYDNGQSGVVKVIITVFTALFKDVEFRKAAQKDYKMLQVADLVCAAKLTELKMKNKTLSKSERRVLGSDRDIQKNILRPLQRKQFKD